MRDLDMEVYKDDCRSYTGNQMTTTEVSRLQGSAMNCGIFTYDSVNNVEMIVLPAYATSPFYLDIYVTMGVLGTSQPFAIFASNAY